MIGSKHDVHLLPGSPIFHSFQLVHFFSYARSNFTFVFPLFNFLTDAILRSIWEFGQPDLLFFMKPPSPVVPGYKKLTTYNIFWSVFNKTIVFLYVIKFICLKISSKAKIYFIFIFEDLIC